MKNMLLLAILLFIIFIVYKNRNLLQEGKKNKSRKGKGKKNKSRKGKGKKNKSRKGKKGSNKIKPKPFIAWDGDKYKSCERCCNDDDGCYDSRCFGKCSKRSFRRGDGTLKRRPVKP